MKGIYLMLVTIYTYVFLATGNEEPMPAYCFHFTWPGSHSNLNCTDCNNTVTPCIIPSYLSKKNPNVTQIWEDEKKKSEKCYIEEMGDDVCIKFTYVYNSAVVNISYFHGKVIEDKVMPIESGCYVQYTEGYAIEVCVCKSEAGGSKQPCNSTIRNTHSALIIFAVTAVSLFMYKIFGIP